MLQVGIERKTSKFRVRRSNNRAISFKTAIESITYINHILRASVAPVLVILRIGLTISQKFGTARSTAGG